MTKTDWNSKVGEVYYELKELTEYCGIYRPPGGGGSKAMFKWRCLRCLKEHGPSQYQDIKRFSTAGCCSKTSKYGDARWGYRHITGEYMRSLHHSAKKRNIECSITAEYLFEVWEKQEGRCMYTGLPLKIGKGLASVDRLDSSKGYIPGNVQWVMTKVNLMKWDSTEDEFLTLCSLIVKKNGERDVKKYLDDEGCFQTLSPKGG
jgi:hypothetical protein